jgi:hypothetical protein
MTILFCGGELEDFTSLGTVSVETTTSLFRSTYARMALGVLGGTGNPNQISASFTASTSFSVSFRVNVTGSPFSANIPFFWLSSGGNARLRLKPTGSVPSTIILDKYDGATPTTLATSVLTLPASTTYRFDIIVDNYGSSGRVRVFVDQTLYCDSGVVDVTASGSTSLNGLTLSSGTTSTLSGSKHCYSEVIVCTQDSRTLSLVTLAPNAAGTANAWTGAYTDIDEVTASETDVITSGTANQVFNCNCSNMPTGWSNLTVLAIKVATSAARGATGPSKLAVGCRTNSTDSFPSSVTIDTGYTTPYTTTYETNPVTGVAWTTTEVDAFQIALKSET